MKRTVVIVIVTIAVAIFALFISKTAFSSAPELMPRPVQVGNVSYISGGIGESESNRMKSLAKDYPLEIVFIQKPVTERIAGQKPKQADSEVIDDPESKEQYLANIQLKIKDHHLNEVLNVLTDGPFFLADLPAGRYLLIAEHHGSTKEQWVNIDAEDDQVRNDKATKHQKVVFWWSI